MLHINVKRKISAQFALQAEFTLAPHSQFVGICGPSGAGKTSLLRCLSGVDKAYPSPLCATVGLVFQDSLLFPHLTVAENFALAQRYAHRTLFDLPELLDVFAIEHTLAMDVTQLSGGERQRVALVRALLNGAEWLLLDEPLSAVDENRSQIILAFLRHCVDQQKLRIIMVSHDIGELLLYCDELIELNNGQVQPSASSTSVVKFSGPLQHVNDHQISFSCEQQSLSFYQRVRVENNRGVAVVAVSQMRLSRQRSSHLGVINQFHAFVSAVTLPTQLTKAATTAATTVTRTQQVIITVTQGEMTFSVPVMRPIWEKLQLQVGDSVYVCF